MTRCVSCTNQTSEVEEDIGTKKTKQRSLKTRWIQRYVPIKLECAIDESVSLLIIFIMQYKNGAVCMPVCACVCVCMRMCVRVCICVLLLSM